MSSKDLGTFPTMRTGVDVYYPILAHLGALTDISIVTQKHDNEYFG